MCRSVRSLQRRLKTDDDLLRSGEVRNRTEIFVFGLPNFGGKGHPNRLPNFVMNKRVHKATVILLSLVVAVDYEKLRDVNLAEYRLSPNTYLDKFNALTRSADETSVMLAS